MDDLKTPEQLYLECLMIRNPYGGQLQTLQDLQDRLPMTGSGRNSGKDEVAMSSEKKTRLTTRSTRAGRVAASPLTSPATGSTPSLSSSRSSTPGSKSKPRPSPSSKITLGSIGAMSKLIPAASAGASKVATGAGSRLSPGPIGKVTPGADSNMSSGATAARGSVLSKLREKRAQLEKETSSFKMTGVKSEPKKEPAPVTHALPKSDSPGTVATESLNEPQTQAIKTEPLGALSRRTPSPRLTPTSLRTTPSSGKSGKSIRTRLSTGSIQMNGTTTISAAKEKAEIEEIIKQIDIKAETPTTSHHAKASTSGTKRRVVSGTLAPSDGHHGDHPPPKKRKIGRNDGSGEDNRNDYFCWLCHKEGTLVCCELCPRVYHSKCLGLSGSLPQDWVCPECEKVMRAECVDTRSKAMEMLTLDQLCALLKYGLERMKHEGSEPFQSAVDLSAVPNYPDYVFHPMDLTALEKNIKKKQYGCTEALLSDAKWILHNCIIYNGAHSKLTTSAKLIVKICKHEMNEIELCPDCYLNSCMRRNDDWFSETCRVPHTLVWAKLKGYPFWPSKALRESDGQVDVRFFGAHDRSWVPVSQCYLLSKNIPTSLQKGKKNQGLDHAIKELNRHIKKLKDKFGNFEYAPFRTPYDKTDSYKPVGVKTSGESPEQSSSAGFSRQISQQKTTSMFPKQRSGPGGHKKSVVSKTASALRNKYSAMVTLKKLEMSPEKSVRKLSLTKDVDVSGATSSQGEEDDGNDSFEENEDSDTENDVADENLPNIGDANVEDVLGESNIGDTGSRTSKTKTSNAACADGIQNSEVTNMDIDKDRDTEMKTTAIKPNAKTGKSTVSMGKSRVSPDKGSTELSASPSGNNSFVDRLASKIEAMHREADSEVNNDGDVVDGITGDVVKQKHEHESGIGEKSESESKSGEKDKSLRDKMDIDAGGSFESTEANSNNSSGAGIEKENIDLDETREDIGNYSKDSERDTKEIESGKVQDGVSDAHNIGTSRKDKTPEKEGSHNMGSGKDKMSEKEDSTGSETTKDEQIQAKSEDAKSEIVKSEIAKSESVKSSVSGGGNSKQVSKESYRKKLDTMIASCKEKLGVNVADMSSDSGGDTDNGSEDEEESNDNSDDDVDDNNEGESVSEEEGEDSGEESESGEEGMEDLAEGSHEGFESEKVTTENAKNAKNMSEAEKSENVATDNKDEKKLGESDKSEKSKTENTVSKGAIDTEDNCTKQGSDIDKAEQGDKKGELEPTKVTDSDLKVADASDISDKEKLLTLEGTAVEDSHVNKKHESLNVSDSKPADSETGSVTLGNVSNTSTSECPSKTSDSATDSVSTSPVIQTTSVTSGSGPAVVGASKETRTSEMDQTGSTEAKVATTGSTTPIIATSSPKQGDTSSVTTCKTLVDPNSGELMEVEETEDDGDDSDIEKLVIDLPDTPDRERVKTQKNGKGAKLDTTVIELSDTPDGKQKNLTGTEMDKTVIELSDNSSPEKVKGTRVQSKKRKRCGNDNNVGDRELLAENYMSTKVRKSHNSGLKSQVCISSESEAERGGVNEMDKDMEVPEEEFGAMIDEETGGGSVDEKGGKSLKDKKEGSPQMSGTLITSPARGKGLWSGSLSKECSQSDVGEVLHHGSVLAAATASKISPVNLDGVPTSSKIAEKFSKKLLETINKTFDEMCAEVIRENNSMENVDTLNKQLQQARWDYSVELTELKHNFQLTISEMKSCWKAEKDQLIKTVKTKVESEKEQAVREAKKKQWCAFCGKEAIFYCCWNTSYCDYPCQQNHWPQHMHTCLQTTNKRKATDPVTSNAAIAAAASTPGASPNVSIATVTSVCSPVTQLPDKPVTTEPDHLRLLQSNINAAIHREEERRGEHRAPGVSPKYVPMSSPVGLIQNIRQPTSVAMAGGMMYAAQIPRQRFNVQPMPLPQNRAQNPAQVGNRMVFSQPVMQQAIYPLQVQPQQQLLFQNAQPQNMMAFGMPRPF